MIPPIIGFEVFGRRSFAFLLCLALKMLFQSCQTATKSFLLQNSLMGVGVDADPYRSMLSANFCSAAEFSGLAARTEDLPPSQARGLPSILVTTPPASETMRDPAA